MREIAPSPLPAVMLLASPGLSRRAGVAGLVCALLAAAFIAQVVLLSRSSLMLAPFLLLVIVGAVAGVVLVFGPEQELQPGRWTVTPAPARLPGACYLLGAAAVACAVEAAWLVHTTGPPLAATMLWLAGLALLLAGALGPEGLAWLGTLPRRARAWLGGGWRRTSTPALLLVVILAVGAALRLPALDTAPWFVQYDEARNGLMGRFVADGQMRSLFSYGWASLPMLGFTWDGLFLKLLGDNLTSLRLSSVVLGLGSLVVVAKLGSELFGRRAGLLAAALLALFHMHIHYSRAGHHYIHALFCVVLTLYLVVYALRRGSRPAAMGTGVLLSVDLQVYFAARVCVLLVPLLVGYILLVSDRGLLRYRLGTVTWMMLGLVVGGAPIGALIAGDWGTFMRRTQLIEVLANTADARSYALRTFDTTNPLVILRTQTWTVLETFNFLRNTSVSYQLPHPLLDPLSAACLPAALNYAACRVGRAGFAVCLFTFGGVLVTGGVLTQDQPYWPRLIAVLPALALLLGAFLDGLWQVLEGLPHLARPTLVAALVLFAGIAFGNYQWYFSQYLPQARRDWFSASTDVGNYLRGIPDHPYAYGLTDRSFLLTNGTVPFLAPQAGTCDVVVKQKLDFRSCRDRGATDRNFVIARMNTGFIPQLERMFPWGTLRLLQTYGPLQVIEIYRVQQATAPRH